MSRSSKKFSPSRWAERLVPVMLVLLALGLVGTIVFVLISILGLVPSL